MGTSKELLNNYGEHQKIRVYLGKKIKSVFYFNLERLLREKQEEI